MTKKVALHKLTDLSIKETPNEIFLDTQKNTELKIEVIGEGTIVSFPFGNKFDIIGGRIYVYEKL